jgi:hypothetical protein
MDTRIPIPTDNIYKFYALFGLVAVITCLTLLVYLNKTTNDFLIQAWVADAELSVIKNPSPLDTAKRESLQKNIELVSENKQFFLQGLSLFIALAGYALATGFYVWHNRIQPKQDLLLDLQIEKARLELMQLRLIKCSRKLR